MALVHKEAKQAWGYVSGRCAALQSAFVGREFFLELLRETTAGGAQARLSKTVFGHWFPTVDVVYSYDSVLGDVYLERVKDLKTASPSRGPADYFLMGRELQQAHERAAADGGEGTARAEVEERLEKLSQTAPWLERISYAALEGKLFASHPARALSLLIDSAYVGGIMKLAASRPDIEPYLRAAAIICVIKICSRSRGNGWDPAWLDEYFFTGALPEALAGAAREAATSGSYGRLAGMFPPVRRGLPDAARAALFDKRADDCLGEIAGEGKTEAFGAGLVLYYLHRLWAEYFDLRMCLAAILTPLDRQTITTRLRSE